MTLSTGKSQTMKSRVKKKDIERNPEETSIERARGRDKDGE
jgi:hypothetical protein